ncbi:MAG: hypothetical protein NVS2B7_32170 [Herpetosiphon sp.]
MCYGYGYRWLRTKDDMTVQPLWESSDPIHCQLLGHQRQQLLRSDGCGCAAAQLAA